MNCPNTKSPNITNGTKQKPRKWYYRRLGNLTVSENIPTGGTSLVECRR
ncbi:MAG: hypothetical protein ABI876_08200 [Bacteroidota bacterium]